MFWEGAISSAHLDLITDKAARKSTGVPQLVPHSARQEEAQKSRTEVAARNFKSFKQRMKVCLPEMSAGQRDALLKQLYRLSKVKILLDQHLARERKGANIAYVFRKYRLWLVDLQTELNKAMKAMREAVNTANEYPKRFELDKIDIDKDDLDKDELQKLVVGKTLNGLAHALNEIEKVMAFVKHAQHSLAKGTNPKLRTGAEKRLVLQEPKGLEHHLLLGEKSLEIDLRFLREADSALDKYHNKDGKPIAGRPQILAKLFESAFGSRRSESSTQKYLSPSRRNRRQPS